MEDFIDKTFAPLDDYYPGSKRKRKDAVEPLPKIAVGWDSRPYKKTMPNGTDMEMFTLGALAEALGRPIVTLRVWMKQGHIPLSPYRLPARLDKNGETRKGRRLYTRPMVEAAVEVFRSNGLLDNPRVDWSVHQRVGDDIAEAWSNIRAQETENSAN
jgi:hypothetical protein